MTDVEIFKSTTIPQAAFSAAVTDVITSNAHGMVEGDLVFVSTTTTLPAGLSASTNYYVIDPTTNTFKLSATRGGSSVDITTTGTGTHTYKLKGKTIYVGDYRHIKVALDFSDTPTMRVKFQSSDQESVDFAASQSATNDWDYVEVIDGEDGTSFEGDTGFNCTGSSDHRKFIYNLDSATWVTVNITSWTAGKLGIILSAYKN